MPLPEVLCKQVTDLIERFEECTNELERLYAARRYRNYLAHRKETLLPIYRAACNLLRDVDSPYRNEVFDALLAILGEEIGEEVDTDICCKTFKPKDYRGKTSVLEDRRPGGNAIDEVDEEGAEDPNRRLHPKSHPFASFSLDPSITTLAGSNRSVKLVYDARCEISSVRGRRSRSSKAQRADLVLDLQLSTGGSCLVALGRTETNVIHPKDNQTDYRYPTPWVSFHLPKRSDSEFNNLIKRREVRFKVGLSGNVSHMTLDERRRLIFVADEDRIKSFQWASADEPYYSRPIPMHTMYSRGFDGPIAALAGDTLLRAGNGAVAVWYHDELRTHSYRSRRFYLLRGEIRTPYLIGGRMYPINELYYDSHGNKYPPRENSHGSPKYSAVTFADDPKLKPHIMRALHGCRYTILAAGRKEPSCITIDLQHGGKTATRYQGHSGYVTNISTSAADQRVFLTSSRHDKYARLFDIRRPQPVLQFTAGQAGQECGAIALAYPGGIPTVFTASRYNQDFKVWDVRSRACVYELGTDECKASFIRSLTWDGRDRSLYALKSHSNDCHSLHYINDKSEGHKNNTGSSSHSRIYQYSFKEKPKYSIVINEEFEGSEVEFSDEGDSDEE